MRVLAARFLSLALLCHASIHAQDNRATTETPAPGKTTVDGIVVDEAGKALPGVKVRLFQLAIGIARGSFRTELADQGTTGADGTFQLTMDGDPDDQRTVGLVLAERTGLSVSWGNRRPGVDGPMTIRMTQPEELSGTVVDEKGQGLAGATVTACAAVVGSGADGQFLMGEPAKQAFSAETGAGGAFRLTGLPDGASVELVVKAPGRGTVCTFDPVGRRGEGLQYAAGQSDAKILLQPEGIVRGTVKDKGTDKPVGGVCLRTTRGSFSWMDTGAGTVTSSRDGTFVVKALPPGEHQVVTAPPAEGSAEWVSQAVTVDVEAGRTVDGVSVQVSKGAVLEVVVKAADGEKPLAGTSVNVMSPTGGNATQAQTDGEGVARFRLPPGDYRVFHAIKAGYDAYQSNEAVTLAEGDTHRVEVELGAPPKISGIVRDPTGKPAPHIDVSTVPMGQQRTKTDAQGHFELTWSRRYLGGGEETHLAVVARDPERKLAAAVKYGEDTKAVELKLAPGGTLVGRVVDEGGKPISKARISVLLRLAHFSSTISHTAIEVDDAGRFSIEGVPTGFKYHVTATAEGYGQKSATTELEDSPGTTVEVEDMVLAVADQILEGVVVDEDDKPVAQARVYAYGSGQPHRNARTGKDGTFRLEGLCKGQLQVSANKSIGGKNAMGSAQAEAGDKDVRVVLGENASVASAPSALPKPAPSLVGRPLPKLDDFGLKPSPESGQTGPLLVCFWDMAQRPSRHCVKQLAGRADVLAQKTVTIVTVHASPVEADALRAWRSQAGVSLRTGMVGAKPEKTLRTWGVRGLPWLILTDAKRHVVADGFDLSDLDGKLAKTDGKDR